MVLFFYSLKLKTSIMDGNYIMVSIVAFIIWVGTLSIIIASSTKSKEKVLLQKAQLSILIELAMKADVPLERIKSILDDCSKR